MNLVLSTASRILCKECADDWFVVELQVTRDTFKDGSTLLKFGRKSLKLSSWLLLLAMPLFALALVLGENLKVVALLVAFEAFAVGSIGMAGYGVGVLFKKAAEPRGLLRKAETKFFLQKKRLKRLVSGEGNTAP